MCTADKMSGRWVCFEVKEVEAEKRVEWNWIMCLSAPYFSWYLLLLYSWMNGVLGWCDGECGKSMFYAEVCASSGNTGGVVGGSFGDNRRGLKHK